MTPDDIVGAFCPHEDVTLPGAPSGPLAGLRFAAKDTFDVAGYVTGAGNPDWRRTHESARNTSPVIETLVDAGATLVGKTITDELAFSLLGVNAHYGTPVNPQAPDSIPGGSSSGSASATAAGLVDFAIGTDTGGSVRVPAALCGLYGFRPTHGRVSLVGAFPLASSFDTVGWFAREALVLWQLSQVLLDSADANADPHGDPHAGGDTGREPASWTDSGAAVTKIVLAEDVWDAADEPVVDILLPEVQRLAMRHEVRHLEVLAEEGLDDWSNTFGVLQGREIWREHGGWLESVNPTLSLDVKNRFDAVKAISEHDETRALACRDQISARLRALLGPSTVLALPTAPEIAPLLESTDGEFAEFRRRTLALTCIASLGGLPQVTVPVAALAEYPVGLSFIGGAGSDRQLIALAATLTRPPS